MKIYPDENVKNGCTFGFEIDNIYVSIGSVDRVLRSIDGVTEIKKRKLFGEWDGTHIWFKYMNHECVVLEPFGDSSRYWIGPKNMEENFDIAAIRNAFLQYHPPSVIKFFGDIITLNFLKK